MTITDTAKISIRRYNAVRRFWDKFYSDYMRGFIFSNSTWTPTTGDAYKAHFEYLNPDTKVKQKFSFTAVFSLNSIEWTMNDFEMV